MIQLALHDRRDHRNEETTAIMRLETFHCRNGVHRLVPTPVRAERSGMNLLCSDGRNPCSAKPIPCSPQNRESSATPWNCCVKRRRNTAKGGELVRNFQNSLLFSLFWGNSRRFGIAVRGWPPLPPFWQNEIPPFYANDISALQRARGRGCDTGRNIEI